MKSGFRRIRTPKVARLAYDQIIKALRSGKYAIGDRFPSETEIAQLMGVSRATVREVYSGLRLLGILETRAGQGTFVVCLPVEDMSGSEDVDLLRGVGETAALPVVIGTLKQGGLDRHIVETRRILEGAAVRLAIKRGTSKEIAAIQVALKAMERFIRLGDTQSSNDSNIAYHAAIAAAAGNPVLQREISALINYGQHNVWLELLERGTGQSEVEMRQEEVLSAHEELYQAVLSRDAKAAMIALNRHFALLRDALGL